MTLGSSLVVSRSDLDHMEVRPSVLTDGSTPPTGSALLAIESFALSTHTVTTAASADSTGAWRHFPAPDGFGHIPTFGRARVARSGHPDLAEGLEVTGYLPMATHLLVTPERIDPRGFCDGSPHRRGSAAVHDRYLIRAVDPTSVASEDPDLEVALRPQFTMAFLVVAGVSARSMDEVAAVVVTSASCRTALGVAHLLGALEHPPAVIGVTRDDHVADTAASGCYDRVLSYRDVVSLPVGPTMVVDFCGDGAVAHDIHHHLGDSLLRSIVVGATHRNAVPVDTAALPGATREIFLAPEVAEDLRRRVDDAAIEVAFTDAWRSFLRRLHGWWEPREVVGPDAVVGAYRRAREGSVGVRELVVGSLR